MYIFSRRHCRPLMYSTQQIDHPKNSALALPFKSFLTGLEEYMGTVGKFSPLNFYQPYFKCPNLVLADGYLHYLLIVGPVLNPIPNRVAWVSDYTHYSPTIWACPHLNWTFSTVPGLSGLLELLNKTISSSNLT